MEQRGNFRHTERSTFKELFHSFINRFFHLLDKLASNADALWACHEIFEEDYVTSTKNVCLGLAVSVAKRLGLNTGKTGRARCDG